MPRRLETAGAVLLIVSALAAGPLPAQEGGAPSPGPRPFTIAPVNDQADVQAFGAGLVAYKAGAVVVHFKWISLRNSPMTGGTGFSVVFLDVSLTDAAGAKTFATSERVWVDSVIAPDSEYSLRDLELPLAVSELKEDFVIKLTAYVRIPDGRVGIWPAQSRIIPISALMYVR